MGNRETMRSVGWIDLFDEGSAEAMLAGPCDAVCLDLEDKVPEAWKVWAREKAVKLLRRARPEERRIIVRVNPMDSAFFWDDLSKVIAVAPPWAVRLPKCESTREVIRLDGLLSAVERERGMGRSIGILPMMESPASARRAAELAACSRRVWALGVGMKDLAAHLGIGCWYRSGDAALARVRREAVAAARRAGCPIIDASLGIHVPCRERNLRTQASREEGFDGRSVDSAGEAAFANEVFSR